MEVRNDRLDPRRNTGAPKTGLFGASGPAAARETGDVQGDFFARSLDQASADSGDPERQRRLGALMSALDDAGNLLVASPTPDRLVGYRLALEQALGFAVGGSLGLSAPFRIAQRFSDEQPLARVVESVDHELESLAALIRDQELGRLDKVLLSNAVLRIRGLLVDIGLDDKVR